MAHDRGSVPDDAAVLDVWERSSALERPWRELALLELGVRPQELVDAIHRPGGHPRPLKLSGCFFRSAFRSPGLDWPAQLLFVRLAVGQGGK